jgi:hypothetical protein
MASGPSDYGDQFVKDGQVFPGILLGYEVFFLAPEFSGH